MDHQCHFQWLFFFFLPLDIIYLKWYLLLFVLLLSHKDQVNCNFFFGNWLLKCTISNHIISLITLFIYFYCYIWIHSEINSLIPLNFFFISSRVISRNNCYKYFLLHMDIQLQRHPRFFFFFFFLIQVIKYSYLSVKRYLTFGKLGIQF